MVWGIINELRVLQNRLNSIKVIFISIIKFICVELINQIENIYLDSSEDLKLYKSFGFIEAKGLKDLKGEGEKS